jgi:hypothetical protein
MGAAGCAIHVPALSSPLVGAGRAEASVQDGAQGGCQCGAVRYRLEGGPRRLAACHCRDCQRQSGSAFGLSLDVPEEAFRLLSGELRSFTLACDSGRSKECAFCARCGTRIYHRGAWGMSVKAGTLDDTSKLRPDAHYWTKRMQPWVQIPEGVPRFPDDG